MHNRICVTTTVLNKGINRVTEVCNGRITSGCLGYSRRDVHKSKAKFYRAQNIPH